MMKKALFSVLVLIAALTSCSKEQSNPTQGKNEDVKMVPVTFTAGQATKTHLGTDGLSVIWQANDQISIFSNGNNYQFTLESGANTSSATFSGEMSETDAAASEFYALYPYDATSTIADGVITTKGIANSQNYNCWGSFSNKLAQSVAHTTGSNFEFKLACSLMTFTIPAEMDKLLKQVMISCNGGASSEPFVGGTAAITVADEPTVKLTSGLGDVMTSNSEGMAAATYYVPVYPQTFAKGIRVKLIYVDNRTSEYVFTGKQVAAKRASKFNVGTLHPQPTYVFENFEGYELSAAGSNELKFQDKKFLTGNTGALKVVENPYPTEANPSAKVLANDMSAATWSTSGYVQVDFGQDPIKFRFPYAARDKFKGIRFKVYIGTSDYYPTLQIDASGSSGNKFPSKVNDVATGGDAAVYAENLKHDDWNVLEFNLATCGYTGSFTSNFGQLNNWQIRPFVTSSKGNCAAALSETNLKLCYIDDIEFLYN